MITMQQALDANEFHYGTCRKRVGPRGGVTITSEVWRRNGRTKTWVTRPSEFIVPIKYGLRTCSKIVESDAANWHTPDQCPLNADRQMPATARLAKGVRVRMPEDRDEGWAEETGTVIEYDAQHQIVTVELDEQYRDGADDDDIRETGAEFVRILEGKHPPTKQHECAGGCGRMIGMHVAQCWRCRTRTAEARL